MFLLPFILFFAGVFFVALLFMQIFYLHRITCQKTLAKQTFFMQILIIGKLFSVSNETVKFGAEAVETVKDAAAFVGDKIEDAKEAFKDKIEDVVETVGEKVDEGQQKPKTVSFLILLNNSILYSD